LDRDGKHSYDDYEQFSELLPKLETVVAQRLVGEKRLSESDSKNWHFSSSTITDTKDKSLRHTDLFVRVEKKVNQFNTDAQPFNSSLQRNFYRHYSGSGKTLDKFLEE